MSKQSRGKSWLDFRLADRLSTPDGETTVQLVARRGTGVRGFRMTVVYLSREGTGEKTAELPPAASTAEVHETARALTGNVDRLSEIYREAVRE